MFGAAMAMGIVLLALAFGPPELGRPPDPSIIAADPRPDWYLLWYFAVLALLPKGTETYFMVFGPVLAGILLISLPFISRSGERSVRRRPWAVAIVVAVILMIGSFWIAGARSNWSPNFQARPLSQAAIASSDPQVITGAKLFYDKGCLNCHLIGRNGGRRGPDLSNIGATRSREQLTLTILTGRGNMPAFANTVSPQEMDSLLAFLESRKQKP